MFAADGSYTVTLEVTNQGGAATKSTGNHDRNGNGPTDMRQADRQLHLDDRAANKVYTYLDASTVADPVNCPITDWLWTFTDKRQPQSNAQNPAPVTTATTATTLSRSR